MSRKSLATIELVLEAVREHFRAAISQERGRLATLNLARRPLEPVPVGSGDTEHAAQERLAAADVIDLATLRRFRQQHTDLPNEVREAIQSLGGVRLWKRHQLRSIATLLGTRV